MMGFPGWQSREQMAFGEIAGMRSASGAFNPGF